MEVEIPDQVHEKTFLQVFLSGWIDRCWHGDMVMVNPGPAVSIFAKAQQIVLVRRGQLPRIRTYVHHFRIES